MGPFFPIRVGVIASVLVAGAWLASGVRAGAQEGRPVLQSYSSAQTGAHDSIWSATQDREGVMYFGANAVISFDGNRWRRYEVPGGYAVRTMAAGVDGRLWVGAVNQIGYFERQGFSLGAFHSLTKQVPAEVGDVGEVWHVFSDGEGAIFVAAHWMLWWDGRSFRTWHFPGGRRLVAGRVGGKVWLSSGEIGLCVLEPTGPRTIIPRGALGDASVFCAREEGDELLLVTSRGLYRWRESGATPLSPAVAQFCSSYVVTHAQALNSGEFCIATARGGLMIVSPEGVVRRRLNADNGLPSRAVYATYQDREGALWLMSPTRVMRLPLDGSTSLFDASTGLAGHPVRGLARLGAQVIALTSEGVFSLDTNAGDQARFRLMSEFKGDYYDLQSTLTGVFVPAFKGLDFYDGSTLRRVLSSPTDVVVMFPSTVHPGSYYYTDGMKLAELTPLPGGQWNSTWLADFPDMPVGLATAPEGDLWLATQTRGLFRLRAGTRGEPESVDLGLGDPPGPTWVANVSGAIVAFTARGAFTLTPEGFRRVGALPAATEWRVADETDDQGRLWLAARSTRDDADEWALGALSVDEDGRFYWSPMAIEGLAQIGHIDKLLPDVERLLWIAGSEGLLRVDLERCRAVPPPPQPLLQATVADGVELPADNAGVTYVFAAPQFGRERGLRFQTALAENLLEWSAPTANAEATFSELRSGRYTFHVRVVNAEGVAGPATRHRFTVLKPWFLRGWAIAGFAFAGGLGIAGVVQWRSRRLRRHNAQLEELVQRKTAQLEKANAAKTEFVANMSHEIRNPISGILGLSLALEQSGLDARQKALTASVRSCAELLATLVEDVLDFAQIEAGKFELRPVTFEVRALLEQCVAMLAEEARQSGTPLRIEVSPELARAVVGDRARIQQIILNYLTNALKFAPGHEVVLEATPAEGHGVRLTVRDHGPGIPEAARSVLFEKFSRLETARTERIRGTGLGLAVCKVLAERMGGTVGLDSREGEGACFWVTLPLRFAEPAAEPAPTMATRPWRALVVEDLDYNATALQAVLRGLGIASDVATDGREALVRLQRESFDVAFLDLHLPGLSGQEVARAYRAAAGERSRTRLIATSANVTVEDEAACRAAGVDAFVAKPLLPDKIRRALREIGLAAGAGAATEKPAEASVETAEGRPLDLSLLRFLADEKAGGLDAQIDRYLTTCAELCAEAGAALQTADVGRRRRAGHALMSQGRVINATALTDIGGAFEAAAEAERATLAKLLADYERELVALTRRLAAYRAAPAPA